MSELVIVKVKDGIRINADKMEYLRKKIMEQKETGVIILPWFLTAVEVSGNIEIQFESEVQQ